MGANGAGQQGLFLSGEFLNIGNPFPELEHYQQAGQDPNALISYFEYGDPGFNPTPDTAAASELRSMFLFTLEGTMEGLDSNLRRGDPFNPLIQNIYGAARLERPDFVVDTLEVLYSHPDDASFCRALENACLESTDKAYFQTTSVRDGVCSNVIMRGPVRPPGGPLPLPNLVPQGRVTFFVQDGQVGRGVFSVSDMLYNAHFEDPTLGVGQLPRAEDFRNMLYEAANHSLGQLTEQFEIMLADQPPSDAMQLLAENIVTLSGQLEQRNLQGSMEQLTLLETQLQGVILVGLPPLEIRVLDVVTGVMRSLTDMTRAIDAVQDRIDNPGQDRPEDVPDIEDPLEHELVPTFDVALEAK